MNTNYEIIKKARLQLGLSQKELAARIGISDRAVSKWELGLSVPSTANLLKLSKALSLPLDFFLKSNTKTFATTKSIPQGMESLTELYRIGRGPSSSHTIGPETACLKFKNDHLDADEFQVILYGSLAKTGKGHGTDTVIKKSFSPYNVKIIFDTSAVDIPHPNTMDIFALKKEKISDVVRVMSIGGGSIAYAGEKEKKSPLIYRETSFSEIAAYCKKNSIRLWQYAEEREDNHFKKYIYDVWEQMKASIKQGLEDEGCLPGGLNVRKKAKTLYNSQHIDESAEIRENRIICSYAFAVSEQNASGEKIVTAPTCGSAGVLPSVLFYRSQKNDFGDEQIIHALETAGLIGNLIKTNASISGAECGCQAEIGSACAMAAAALAELFNLNIDKIEYAAEIAIEHHLGLTCDPICGLVQIPCIERNAVAAMRAVNAVNLASFLWNTRKISFDRVVKAMKETGLDLSSEYKETSEAGLAKITL